MRSVLKTFALAACLAVGSVGSAHAVVATPAASATMDWSTFSYQLFSFGNPTPTLTMDPLTQTTNIYAQQSENASDGVADWTTGPLSVIDGVATASATSGMLTAQFTSLPPIPGLSAQSSRSGSFVLSANSYVVFSVSVDTSINMTAPTGGAAYAWSYLSAEGQDMFGGADIQRSTTDKISWADELGTPVQNSGTLYATFANLTAGDISGTINGFAQVNSYGATIVFVPEVPEPGTYMMLLAGLALLGTVAARRKSLPIRS